MLKTYVSVIAVGKVPEIVKGFIDKNGEWTDKIEEARACIRNPMFYIR